jgi:hypothetical protein
MIDAKELVRSRNKCSVLHIAVGFAGVILASAVILLSAPKAAQATPKYAQETGLPCSQCHVSAAGGSALKPFGKKFQANGHKVAK